ncbi:MAG: YitT family protein [Bacilli bacterium]
MISKKKVKQYSLIIASAILQAFALNNFFETSGLLTSGVTGVAMILKILSNGKLSLSLVMLSLNLPLAIFSYFHIGKKFTIMSFAQVVLTSIFLPIIPVFIEIDSIMLNAIFGGAILGLGTALALESSASTGGTDFIALYISVKKQVSAGKYMMYLNGVIVLISAQFFGFEIAAYTLVSIYVGSRVIDSIHVRYQRLTVNIITSHGPEIITKMLANGVHGITKLEAEGAYSQTSKTLIYTVVSAYEITDLRDLVFEIDQNAFVNITQTISIYGKFTPTKYE